MARGRRIDKDRLRDLLHQGLSQQQIADRLGCSQTTVSKTRRDFEKAGETFPAMTLGRPRKDKPPPPKRELEALEPNPGEDELIGLDRHEVGNALFGVYGSEHLPAIARKIRHAIADDNLRDLDKWIALEIKIKHQLAAAIPPPPPDPAEDPANLEARKFVREELTRLAGIRESKLREQLKGEIVGGLFGTLCGECREQLAGTGT